MKKQPVLVTRRVPEQIMAQLADAADLHIWEENIPMPYDEIIKQAADCAGIYCLLTDTIDDAVLDAAGESLKVVSQMAVGYDNIDVKACTQRGIPVGNTPGVLTDTTADLTIALLMAAARRVVEAAQFVKEGQWKTWRPMELTGVDVYGSTVGIVGLGRIGQAVAKRLGGFDCRLLYTEKSPAPEADGLGATFVPMDTLLTESDFVTLHVPLNDDTHHLIGAGELAQMKKSAMLINTSRGPVVDEQALIQALQAGQIAGAGLDVTNPEPINIDNPLLSMPNVVVLPHIGSASVATRTRMAQMAADNLIAGLNDQPLPNCVNPDVYTL